MICIRPLVFHLPVEHLRRNVRLRVQECGRRTAEDRDRWHTTWWKRGEKVRSSWAEGRDGRKYAPAQVQGIYIAARLKLRLTTGPRRLSSPSPDPPPSYPSRPTLYVTSCLNGGPRHREQHLLRAAPRFYLEKKHTFPPFSFPLFPRHFLFFFYSAPSESNGLSCNYT